MKVIFMGTPDFAAPALAAIHSGGHDIRYVITQQDREKGRGKRVQYTPVKEKAMELGLEVLQPEKLKGNAEITGVISDCQPDMIVVAAYGNLLPDDILSIPVFGCLNIHASLLPRWRGASPIQRAIIEGDETTGITIMQMDKGVDTGDIILSRGTEVGRKTASMLQNELALMGAELITAAIEKVNNGSAERRRQNDEFATYAPMISKKDGELNFRDDPEKLERLVRGLDPWPGAYTFYKGEMIKIWEAVAENRENAYKAGTMTNISDDGIEISAGGKTLRVTEIQIPGKKRIKIKEYLKGNKIEKFAVLG